MGRSRYGVREFKTRIGTVSKRIPSELMDIESLSYFDHRDDHCVYFLIHNGAVNYVGMTKCLSKRIAAHRLDKKDFQFVVFVRCGSTIAPDLEQAFIRYYRPPRNGPRIRDLCPYHRSLLFGVGITKLRLSKEHKQNGRGAKDGAKKNIKDFTAKDGAALVDRRRSRVHVDSNIDIEALRCDESDTVNQDRAASSI